MGKPGAKKNDPIVSVTPGDVHIIMIPSPGGPVPTPIPHPCASMIDSGLAEKVKVMGQPGAVKGSGSSHKPPHIPMGPGPFQKPPKNKGKIITGSANVFYEGKEAAMLGDTGEMCSDPSDTPVGKVIGTAAMVLVGGGGAGSDEARAAAAAAAMKAAAAECHRWINKNMPKGAAQQQAHKSVCKATGHPVDVATGKLFTEVVETTLKGRIRLEIARLYSSASQDRGPMGVGWRHSWEVELVDGPGFVALRDETGRFVPFAPAANGATSPSAHGRFRLERAADGSYAVRLKSGLRYRFGAPRKSHPDAQTLPLIAVEDANGNRATLRHENGRLALFRDTAGREVQFVYDPQGLLTALRLKESQALPFKDLARYSYKDGMLVAAEDGMGKRWTYEYEGHRLTRETNRCGESFYFRYDAEGRCVETWGDGGLLYRRLHYDAGKGRTLVFNGLGYRRLYEWNAQGVVTKETDHAGRTLRFEYNDFIECVAEENSLGHRWAYTYDDDGRLVGLELPDGTALAYVWDGQGRLKEKIDHTGGKWSWSYDATGREATCTDPLKQQSVESYNERGELVKLRGPDGREVRFVYDASGNCVEMTNGDGLRVQRAYNAAGEILREDDQFGPRFETEYDPLGLPLFVRQRGQGESRFERDAEGRITRVTNSRGRSYEFSYLPFLGKVMRMRQTTGTTLADGRRVYPERRYHYDVEARLTLMEVDGERTVEFSYEEHNFPWRIRLSDGREQIFERDARGNIHRFWENGELVFTQESDAMGRVTRRVTGDGETFNFEYDPRGNILSGASNGASHPLEFEWDPLGRIVAQRGGAGEISFEYDPIGVCTGYRVGEDLAVGFGLRPSSASGRNLGISVNDRKEIDLTFDARQRLTSAAFAGGDRHEFYYADGYLPYERRISRADSERLREKIAYDPAGLPVRVTRPDGMSRAWERDERDRLVAQKDAGPNGATLSEERWGYDQAGDRAMAKPPSGAVVKGAFASHRPTEFNGERYAYDHRGRLIERIAATGAVTRFHWNSMSQLRRVELPDGGEVDYEYDVLGRRVAKKRGERAERFGWIKNFLVHEDADDGEKRHYLYHTRSHAPLACLRSGDGKQWRCDAVTTDLRGAPIAVTSPDGREVWSADVGAWGDRAVRTGEAAMPLVLQGQYEDPETGLYYNNARYYNPSTGTYISPDPIGPAGGDNGYQFVTDPLSEVDPLGLNPDTIALGLSSKTVTVGQFSGKQDGVLEDFAADPAGDGSVKASMYTKFDKVLTPEGKEDYGKKIGGAMNDAKAIHFNLDGMTNVQDIVNNPDPSRFEPPSTNWELATILSTPELREKTTFWDEKGKKSQQIPCG